MKYQDLLPARYKNVNFYVKKEVLTSGFNNQYSSTPNLIKNRKVINLVLLPNEIGLSIVFTGQLASYNARKFIKLADAKTSGTLQIPTFGIFKNMVIKEAFSVNTDLKEVGVITCEVAFVENLEALNQKNLLSTLDELTLKLDDLLTKWTDAFYFLSNLTEKVNTIKANINKAFTMLKVPLIEFQDLSNSLKLNQFYNNKLNELSNIQDSYLAIINQDKQINSLPNTNNDIENKQISPINVLNLKNKINNYRAYLNSLVSKEYIYQEQINDDINKIFEYSNNILFESNLTIEIEEILIEIINTTTDYLIEKMDNLPQIQIFEVKNESLLMAIYRSSGNIENVSLIEKINNLEDIDDFTGGVKCLKS
jgi:hypothetical protein